MEARSPVNFRAFCLIAVLIVGAVFCSYLYMLSHAAGIAVGCVYIVGIASAAAVFCVRFVRKKSKFRVFLALTIALVLSVSAFTVAVVYVNGRERSMDHAGYHNITGRVCAFNVRTGEYALDLEDVTFDGVPASGKLRLSLNGDDKDVGFLRCGDNLRFGAYVTVKPLVAGGRVNGTSYRTGIIYYASVSVSAIGVDFGSPGPIEWLHTALRDLMTDNMGDHYGNIAFSMLTGDKNMLELKTGNYYSSAGLGHIMAVSGLHVGFLVLMLDFLLARTGKRVRFGVITAVLLLYTVFAGFSPSVIRATIMSVISMFAVFVGGRRDILSSLSIAFSLILAVSPLYLFETGFLLSFGAIFGIAMFSGSITRVLERKKVHRSIATGVASAASVQAGVIPTQIYFFHTFSPLAMIVNVVVLPYISVVFIAIVACSLIGAIPGLSPVLAVPQYLMMPVDFIAQGIAAVPYSSFDVYATCGVFVCFPIMFCMSEFFMMPRGKTAVVAFSTAVCLLFCTLSASALPGRFVAAINSSDTNSVISDGKGVYVIGYADSSYGLRNFLTEYGFTHVDAVYLLDPDANAATELVKLNDSIKIDMVYGESFADCGDILINNGLDYAVPDSLYDGPVMPVYHSGSFIGYDCEGILFARDGVTADRMYGYETVRIKTIASPSPYAMYLCNYCEDSYDNVAVLTGDGYVYALD